MKWISIDKRLPEYGEDVILACNDKCGENDYPYLEVGNRSHTDKNGEHFSNREQGDEDVTHWMPLPELPNP